MKIETLTTAEEALRSLSEKLISIIGQSRVNPFHIALSGGKTAQTLFKIWTKEYKERIPWDILRFYWVDERCVAPDDDESNFKHAEQLLFHPLQIPIDHIHRIWGEQDPNIEAERYSEMVKWELPGYSDLPRFNCIILGVGTDGHTASIFPESSNLLTDRRCYAVSQHPATGQKRISMTGPLILQGKHILVPILDPEKKEILEHIVRGEGDFPALYLLSKAHNACIYTDQII